MLQTIISCTLLLLGLYISFLNTWAVVLWLAGKLEGNHSAVPLVGGFLAMLGCAFSPWPVVKAAWWVPLILDYGSLPLLLSAVVYIPWQMIKSSRTTTSALDTAASVDPKEKEA